MSTTRLAQRCTAQRADGQPCGAFALAGGLFCLSHDPRRAAQLAESRRAGGRARHGRHLGGPGDPVTLQAPADVLALLERVAGELYGLENSIARGRALISLATAWSAVFEASELERRVSALEVLQHEQSSNAR